MLVTPCGIVIDVRPVQLLKAHIPMLTRLCGRDTVVRPVQF